MGHARLDRAAKLAFAAGGVPRGVFPVGGHVHTDGCLAARPRPRGRSTRAQLRAAVNGPILVPSSRSAKPQNATALRPTDGRLVGFESAPHEGTDGTRTVVSFPAAGLFSAAQC